MAELVVLDKAKALPNGYTQLEYIQSNNNHPRIEVDSIKNIAENEIEFQTQIMWVENPNSGGSLNIGFGNADTNTARTFGVTSDGYWKTANTSITPSKQASKNVLYDISYKMYSNKVILEVKNGDTTEVNSTVNYNIPFDGNSIFYPTDYIGYGLRSARIYFSKVYRDGVLVFNGMPAKRNSDNAVGLYDTISNTFYKQIASQSSSSYNFIAGPEILPEYSSVIPVIYLGTSDLPHSNKKYDLYDRVYDDTGKDIGMVSGFQLDQENNEYAVVCLNAEYRLEEDEILSKSGDYGTTKYTNQTVWETKETGTYTTQKILDFLASTTGVNGKYTSKSATYFRTLSFSIDNQLYYGQIPNLPEISNIYSRKDRINKEDPSASTHSNLLLPKGNEIKGFGNNALLNSCTQYDSRDIYIIRIHGTVGAIYRDLTRGCIGVPILELPNPEL